MRILKLLSMTAAVLTMAATTAHARAYQITVQDRGGYSLVPWNAGASSVVWFDFHSVQVWDLGGGDLVHGDPVLVYDESARGYLPTTYYIWNGDNDPGPLKVGGDVVIGYLGPSGWVLIGRPVPVGLPAYGAPWTAPDDWESAGRFRLTGMDAVDAIPEDIVADVEHYRRTGVLPWYASADITDLPDDGYDYVEAAGSKWWVGAVSEDWCDHYYMTTLTRACQKIPASDRVARQACWTKAGQELADCHQEAGKNRKKRRFQAVLLGIGVGAIVAGSGGLATLILIPVVL